MNEPSTVVQNGSNSVQPLPAQWIERLFARLHGRFGNPFFAKWQSGQTSADGLDTGVENAKRVWAEELAGYTPEELKTGISARYGFPPSLDEFKAACRPPSDSRADWAEACEQMRIRLKGHGGDTWSRPQVYWAAVSIGQFDLNQLSWEQIRARWEKALTEAKTEPIPEYRAALPQPGQATTSREEASKRLRDISEKTGISIKAGGAGNTAWALRLAEREASGESLSIIQKNHWRGALCVSHETSAKDVVESYRQQHAA